MTPNVAEGPWWQTGVLDKKVHAPLIQSRQKVATRAGLGERHMHWIWDELPDSVGTGERDWMKTVIARQERPRMGFVFEGKEKPALEIMRAMTGALVRNFKDARIMPVSQIVQTVFDREDVEATVLFLPDACVPEVIHGLQPNARSAVVQLIADRIRQREPVCFYAPSETAIVQSLGDRIRDLMKGEFLKKAV
jgi:hypothetical protein